MTFKTYQTTLHPDGTIGMPRAELPDHSVAVMITLLEPDEENSLAQPRGYQSKLEDYEERLAQRDIEWQ